MCFLLLFCCTVVRFCFWLVGIVLLLNCALWVGGFLAFGYGLIVGIVSCGGLLLCCGCFTAVVYCLIC